MEVSGQLQAPAVLPPPPRERTPSTHWIGVWVDSRASLDTVEKRKYLAHGPANALDLQMLMTCTKKTITASLGKGKC
jgi:hypothetical protein